ncbi:MAG: TonB family protein [Myxococcales bacterium]|nr:TonB family protein [Myxococcales bacterium]
MTGRLGMHVPLRADPAFRWLVAWSLGAHLGLGMVLTLSPSGRALIPAPHAVMVELLTALPGAPAHRPRRQVVDEPVVIPKRPKPAKPVSPRPEARKPPPLTAAQLIAKIRKEIPAEAAGPGTSNPAARSGFVDPLLAAYRSRLQARLRRNWSGARAFAAQPSLLARFEVEINQAGKLVGIAQREGSGNRYFDESAERAIWRAAPFPAPPRGALTLDVNFRPGAVF